MFEHGEKRRGHGPKRRHGNVSSVGEANHPVEESVVYDYCRWKVKTVEEVFKGRLHFGHNGFKEGDEVLGSTLFGWNNVGDCGESDVVGFGVGVDEAEPFFGDDEGYQDLRVFGEEQLAEVHHGIHVTSSWVRHRYHVAGHGWWLFNQMRHRDKNSATSNVSRARDY